MLSGYAISRRAPIKGLQCCADHSVNIQRLTCTHLSSQWIPVIKLVLPQQQQKSAEA
jgi:hypothetical protein